MTPSTMQLTTPSFLLRKGTKGRLGVEVKCQIDGNDSREDVNDIDGNDSREDVGDVGCGDRQAHEGQTNVKILNKEGPHKCGSCRKW